MSDMADVLREHDDWTYLIQRNAMVCKGCGWSKPLSEDESSRDAFRAHQAAALSAAGFGLVRERCAEAWDACVNNNTPWINPYREASNDDQ